MTNTDNQYSSDILSKINELQKREYFDNFLITEEKDCFYYLNHLL